MTIPQNVQVIRAIRAKPDITNQEISDKLGLSSHQVRTCINRLIKRDLLVSEGISSTRTLKLTKAGRAYANKQASWHTVRKPQEVYRGKAQTRACLMCRAPFASKGEGNRICGDCKSTSLWKSGDDDYSVVGGRW